MGSVCDTIRAIIESTSPQVRALQSWQGRAGHSKHGSTRASDDVVDSTDVFANSNPDERQKPLVDWCSGWGDRIIGGGGGGRGGGGVPQRQGFDDELRDRGGKCLNDDRDQETCFRDGGNDGGEGGDVSDGQGAAVEGDL